MNPVKKVAIVGSGCSGLGALWALKSTPHEVHLYESADRLGGHTNTVTFEKNGKETPVDSGFIVLNTATYPNFIAFLKEECIPIIPTEMTFGISRDLGAFEWAGTSLSAVFAQKKNLLRPRVWQMLFDIIRFNQFALDLLTQSPESEVDPVNDIPDFMTAEKHQESLESIGSYLEREGYSDAFKNDYLIPMTACVWSTSPDKCSLDFPAITLVRFLWNHHLLSTISARPTWMTIKGGSKLYIQAITKNHPETQIYLNSHVKSLVPAPNGKIKLILDDGNAREFDHVILATHGDQAMQIIQASATEEETAIMSGFQTSKNTAVLHSDPSLMPLRPVAWSAWNYLTETNQAVPQVCLTYWMNLLQHIPTSEFGDVLITLNPIRQPNPTTVQGRWTYNHPLYNAEAIKSQSLLPSIQNKRGISFAGAWTKYGFHEDGFSSGIKVAIDHLDATLPFKFVDSTFSRGRRPTIGWRDFLVRIVINVILIISKIVAHLLIRYEPEQRMKKVM